MGVDVHRYNYFLSSNFLLFVIFVFPAIAHADNYKSDSAHAHHEVVVTTLAGGGNGVDSYGRPRKGSRNGLGISASFNYPRGIAVDSSGNVYVADGYNDLIRKISTGGVVTTLAGSAGVTGITNGKGSEATFSFPTNVAVDSSGNIYVSERTMNLIRKIQQ